MWTDRSWLEVIVRIKPHVQTRIPTSCVDSQPGILMKPLAERHLTLLGPDDPRRGPGGPSVPILSLTRTLARRCFWPRKSPTNYITLSAPLPCLPDFRKGSENPGHPNRRVGINLWPPCDVCGVLTPSRGPINTSLPKQKLFWRPEIIPKWRSTMSFIVFVRSGGRSRGDSQLTFSCRPLRSGPPPPSRHFSAELR